MSIFSLRLTHKITAIGIIGVTGVILTGGIHFYGESATSVYRAAAENARGIFELSNRIQIDLLEGRRAEKDFLLRNDMKKIDAQIEISKSASGSIEALHGKLIANGKPDLAAKVDEINAGLKQYQALFSMVVEGKRKLGLDEKSGLEGQLRKSVHEIEAQVNQLHQPGLLVTMLMMRRHEKDFILRRDRKYGDEMKLRAVEFTAGIASADVSETAKAELTRKLADYQRDFFAWMETALKLSADLKAMSESFAVVEPALEVISTEVHGLKDAADHSMMALRDKIKQEMAFSILLIAGAVLIMGYFIGRSVSKPLTAMTAAMMDLANGNFSIVLPGLGRADEVGEIAQAVETFKLRAEQKAREEAESRIKQDQVVAEQRKQDMVRLADTFESAVGEIVETVSSASTELEASAGSLTSTAERAQQLTRIVAAASQEASTNVQSVASATEEMSSSVDEISRQVQELARIANEAVDQAQKTNDRASKSRRSRPPLRSWSAQSRKSAARLNGYGKYPRRSRQRWKSRVRPTAKFPAMCRRRRRALSRYLPTLSTCNAGPVKPDRPRRSCWLRRDRCRSTVID